MTEENEIDRIMVDQSVVVARILEATARLGEIQTVVSRALVDLHIPQDKKMMFSFSVTKAITAMNQIALVVFGENLRDVRKAREQGEYDKH